MCVHVRPRASPDATSGGRGSRKLPLFKHSYLGEKPHIPRPTAAVKFTPDPPCNPLSRSLPQPSYSMVESAAAPIGTKEDQRGAASIVAGIALEKSTAKMGRHGDDGYLECNDGTLCHDQDTCCQGEDGHMACCPSVNVSNTPRPLAKRERNVPSSPSRASVARTSSTAAPPGTPAPTSPGSPARFQSLDLDEGENRARRPSKS